MTQRQPRMVDVGYLKWLRLLPCCVCGGTPSDAAHIRFAAKAFGKRYTGMAEKPDDKWAVPLCRKCHTEQHSLNEEVFWLRKSMNPLMRAMWLYKKYGGTGGSVKKKPKKKKSLLKRKMDGTVVRRQK